MSVKEGIAAITDRQKEWGFFGRSKKSSRIHIVQNEGKALCGLERLESTGNTLEWIEDICKSCLKINEVKRI